MRCEAHYAAWAAGEPQARDRAQLREQVFSFARTSADNQRRSLVALASEIGTA